MFVVAAASAGLVANGGVSSKEVQHRSADRFSKDLVFLMAISLASSSRTPYPTVYPTLPRYER